MEMLGSDVRKKDKITSRLSYIATYLCAGRSAATTIAIKLRINETKKAGADHS